MNLKKIAIFISFIIAFMIYFSLEKGQYGKPLSFVSSSAGFIQKSYHYLSSGVRGSTGKYLNLLRVKTENEQLVNENLFIRAQLGELTELKKENMRLYDLLDFKSKNKSELLAAKVIGQDLFKEHHMISLNRGRKDGVKDYMAVITTGTVVGYIIEVHRSTSKVLLLTDKYASIDSIVQRSRIRGLLEGAQEFALLKYLKVDDDVQVGDLIVTSGLQNIFPKGFPIGEVTEVDKIPYQPSQKIKVKPFLNASTLEEAFIVIPNNKNEAL